MFAFVVLIRLPPSTHVANIFSALKTSIEMPPTHFVAAHAHLKRLLYLPKRRERATERKVSRMLETPAIKLVSAGTLAFLLDFFALLFFLFLFHPARNLARLADLAYCTCPLLRQIPDHSKKLFLVPSMGHSSKRESGWACLSRSVLSFVFVSRRSVLWDFG